MKFFGNPTDIWASYGPPTAFQPQWTGQGFKDHVFDSHPVAHVIASDDVHHQVINIYPERAHLPVERALVNYFQETGQHPAEFRLPEDQSMWDQVTEIFGFPDSRPNTVPPSEGLPGDTVQFSSGDLNPVTGRWPSHSPGGRYGRPPRRRGL